jgi:hypothetical protein
MGLPYCLCRLGLSSSQILRMLEIGFKRIFYDRIALAAILLETGPVENLYSAAAVVDQSVFLQLLSLIVSSSRQKRCLVVCKALHASVCSN